MGGLLNAIGHTGGEQFSSTRAEKQAVERGIQENRTGRVVKDGIHILHDPQLMSLH